MTNTAKNLAIGTLCILAFALVVWVLVFLHPTFGDAGKTLHVRFTNIDKINLGTKVTFAGRPVGEVVEITEVPESRVQEESEKDQIYPYELTLALDSSVNMYDSDEVSVKTAGLMGEKFIAISPRRSKTGNPRKLNNDEHIFASSSGSVEETFSDINSVAKKAEQTIDQLGVLIDKNREEFQLMLKSVQGTASEMEKFLQAVNQTNLVANVSMLCKQSENAMHSVQDLLQKTQSENLVPNLALAVKEIRQVTSALNQPNELQAIVKNTSNASKNLNEMILSLSTSWPKIEIAMNKLASSADQVEKIGQSAEQTMKGVQTIIDNVNAGSGTLGKLISNDDLYFKTISLLAKTDIMMNDINHYGVLFHLDKTWQRDRLKRMAELARLQSPQEFKAYLNEELDKISLSISRVNMALAKADEALRSDSQQSQDLAKNELARTYNELLGQIQSLENSLKTNNICLNEKKDDASSMIAEPEQDN